MDGNRIFDVLVSVYFVVFFFFSSRSSSLHPVYLLPCPNWPILLIQEREKNDDVDDDDDDDEDDLTSDLCSFALC
ncbi:hypothetical protein BLOT_000035 [Blomia tropicalis]|nr:hypothetical protein BLOT_000035 [Blomia tropicalis]